MRAVPHRGGSEKLRPEANNRFLPIFAALILAGFSCLSLLSYLRARDLMDRLITSSSLPLTSDAIVFRLEQILLKPMLASGLMGGNNFIEDNIKAGERNPGQLQDYLARIQRKTGAVTTFLVSDRSHRYYHSSGVLKQVSSQDPQDRWYFRFRASGRPIEINIDRDTADLDRLTAFINVPVRGEGGRFLGATGLGLDFHGLQAQLKRKVPAASACRQAVAPRGARGCSLGARRGEGRRREGGANVRGAHRRARRGRARRVRRRRGRRWRRARPGNGGSHGYSPA